MNAKLAKELRRYAAELKEPTRPMAKLLAKPVKLKDGGYATVAINHSASERGIYLALKAAVETTPEILEQLRATAAYKRMVKAQQESGGPLYEHKSYGPGTDSPEMKDALDRSMEQTP